MICKNCGKEIPDTSTFCGYCGTSLKEENIEETETAVPVEELPEEAEVTEAEPAGEPEPEPVEEPAPEVLPDLPPVKKESKAAKAAANAAKSFLAGFKGEEFKELLGILVNPFGAHYPALVPSLCVLLVMWILNWITLREAGGFVTGLLVTLIAFGGTFLIYFLDRGEKNNLKKICSKTVAALFVPMIMVLILCILSFVGSAAVVTYQLMTAVAVLGAVIYAVTVVKTASNIRPYILVVLLTAIGFGLIVVVRSGMTPVIDIFG